MSTFVKAGLLFVVALALVAADKDQSEPKKVALPKADVRGVVKSVDPLRGKDLVCEIYVEGSKEKDTEHAKASVTLTSKTKVYRWNNGKKVEAKVADVTKGCKVQCAFTGEVLESSPVQATAG